MISLDSTLKKDIRVSNANCTSYIDFDFPYCKPDYNDFRNMVNRIKKQYTHVLDRLVEQRDSLLSHFSTEKVIELAREHKYLVNNVLTNIINEYKPLFSDEDVGIFWTGGFARNTNRLSGDYDLNFVYPEALRSKLMPIEEQICLALSEIVGKPRDYVHAVMVCHGRLLKEQKINDTLQPFKFCMHWTDKNCRASHEYNISPRLEDLMFRVHWSSREPEEFQEYLLNSINSNQCCDWSSTYEIVYGSKLLQNIFDNASKKELQISNETNSVEDLNKLVDSRRQHLGILTNNLSQIDLIKVSEIKIQYKKKAFEEIFSTLALIRRKLLTGQIDIGPIKIDNYAENEYIKNLLGHVLFDKFFSQIYNYIWSIIRLEAAFEKKDIRFGTHSIDSIDCSFDQFYNSMYPDISENFRLYQSKTLRKLYSTLDEVLISIR